VRIAGVDPGLNITGYAVVDSQGSRFQLVEAGVIRTRSSDPLETRLHHIYTSFMELLTETMPATAAVEALFMHYARPQTAILRGHARAMIFLGAAHLQIPVRSYPARLVKKALTGSGAASKSQMQLTIRQLLSLPTVPHPPDVADALAIAICHARTLGRELLQS
jgi:crossover junction endodeoxyribonuclease RuvC